MPKISVQTEELVIGKKIGCLRLLSKSRKDFVVCKKWNCGCDCGRYHCVSESDVVSYSCNQERIKHGHTNC